MKKTLAFLILLCALLLVACNPSGDSETNAFILSETETTYKTNGDIIVMKYEYNGDLPIKIKTFKNDILNTVTEMKYDENGFMNYSKQTLESNGFIAEVFYENSSDGKPLTKKYSSSQGDNTTETIWQLEYTDENGSYIEKATVSGIERTQNYSFDEQGNPTKFISANGQTTFYSNKYDDEGNLYEVKITIVGLGVQTIKYEYNEDGMLAIENTYDEDGTLIITKTYSYVKKK